MTGAGHVAQATDDLIHALREGLAHVADPARAEPMRAYMKSTMPFLGVTSPQVAQVCRRVFAAHPLAGFEEWRATTLALWRGAGFREERYTAIALTGDRRYRSFHILDALPVYEEMIVTGAWWDLVDGLAIHRVGGLLARYPEQMRPTMLAWSCDADLWKRRTAILCQNARKAATDQSLLFACIEPNLADPDFFIRKAIGWALREYAKTNASAVLQFAQEHEGALSPLSRREALKHLGDAEASRQ